MVNALMLYGQEAFGGGGGDRRESGDRHAREWSLAGPEIEGVVVTRDLALRSLARLPVRRRAIVVLRFYDDLSEASIAAVLGVSVGTIKSQLSRALEQLRRDLATLEES